MAKHSALAGISLLNKNNRLTGFNKQNISLNFLERQSTEQMEKDAININKYLGQDILQSILEKKKKNFLGILFRKTLYFKFKFEQK